MRSMTGFGAAGARESTFQLRAEVRAVNHKFLQLKIRLPSELAFLEPEVEELVRTRLDRGSVALNVSASGGASLSPIALDVAAARRYKALLVKLARELDLKAEVALEDIARMPGVLSTQSDTRALQRGRRALLKVVAAALDALDEMREREGKALARDLAKHGAAIARITARIETRMPLVVQTHHANLQRRVEELLGSRGSVQPQDLAREVALLADKLDVSEEIARLHSHLGQLDALCAKTTPVGRQLEFLVQEFLREANTVGSKCNDATVAHDVVELKTTIERLREQVQNVE